MLFSRKPSSLPTADAALPGRESRPFVVSERHAVLGTPIDGPFPDNLEVAVFGIGCFWGAEEIFWRLPGVWTTAVGYAGGVSSHPTYEEVCSGGTGHTEAVRVVFDPDQVTFEQLLRVFWEAHDPTQGYRQGNDVGTQYRSAVYWTTEAQRAAVAASRDRYQAALHAAGQGEITTEIAQAGPFFLAEDYHQQYLHKIPHGYRCHSTAGVPYPVSA